VAPVIRSIVAAAVGFPTAVLLAPERPAA